MKQKETIVKKLTIFSVIMGLLAVMPMMAQQASNISDREAETIATEAYIYGYPLITMDTTRRVMTNSVVPENDKAPMGQFFNARRYPNASFKDVTAPNADTLYSFAWLDLSKEPYVLHVPDEKGRYYLMPILSGWTNVFADPGTRTTGTQAGDYAITGLGWNGSLPSGVKEFKSPTNIVWIIGRTYCTGTPEDYQAVHAIQDQYNLMPLSYFGKSYTPPKGKVDPSIDTKKPVRDQVNEMDAATYFKKLALLMKENPPAPEDAEIVAKMAKIGIIAGQDFDMSKLDSNVAQAIQGAPKLGIEKIMAYEKQAGKSVNGWVYSLQMGTYGTDYLQRALVTAIGLGANLPQDAVYPFTNVDNTGNPLDGSHNYVIHFEKGQTPPVDGFWSITMYNDQYYFVENPLNRYTVSPRNQLKYNQDGSLDVYIQNKSPGKDKESNWLPAPTDEFILMLRMYWPKEGVLNGTWQPPAVKLVER